jgi:hypothetical protein
MDAFEPKLSRLPEALLRAGVALGTMLAAARTLFGTSFNALVAQKTLSWFEGGDLSGLSATDRELLVREAARDLTLTDAPKTAPRVD